MRCPECRHRAAPTRWLLFPDELCCYHCGAVLHRGGPLGFAEALLAWVLLMAPLGLALGVGGVGGVVAGCVAAALVAPARPWRGFRYRLAGSERRALPPARALHPDGGAETPDRSLESHPEDPGAR